MTADGPEEANAPRTGIHRSGLAPGAASTRPTAHGAVYAAILALMFLAGQYMPVGGPLLALFCPVPIVLMRLAFPSPRHAGMLVLVAAALVALLTSPIRGGAFLLLVGVPGFALAEGAARRLGAIGTTVVTAAAATLGSGILLAATIFLVEPELMGTLVSQQKAMMRSMFEREIARMREAGKEDDAKRMEGMAKVWIEGMDRMPLVMPAGLYVVSLVTAALNYWASRVALARFRVPLPPFPPFEAWRAPRALAWVLLAGYLFVPFANDPSAVLRTLGVAGLNVLLAAAAFYFLAGLSSLHFMMRRSGMGRSFVVVTWVILVLNILPLMPILALAGLFEQVFDWRGLGREPAAA